MRFEEMPAYLKGLDGEKQVEAIVKEYGLLVTPQYNYSADTPFQGPRIRNDSVSYRLPDLDVSGNGATLKIEVKHFEIPSLFKNTGKLQHGIDEHLHNDYTNIEVKTGIPVWLAVLEKGGPFPGALLCQRITSLPIHHRGSFVDRETGRTRRMVYYNRDQFGGIADLLGHLNVIVKPKFGNERVVPAISPKVAGQNALDAWGIA